MRPHGVLALAGRDGLKVEFHANRILIYAEPFMVLRVE